MVPKSAYPELVNELQGWCRGEALDVTHALMLIVPEDMEIAQIEENLQTIKCLGRVRVRGRMYNRKLDSLAVLCESKEKVDIDKMPSEILPIGGTQTWPIVIVSETPIEVTTTDVRSDTVSDESEREGCLKTLLGSFEGSPEAIIRAVGDLLARIEKPPGEGSSYRRLKIFGTSFGCG